MILHSIRWRLQAWHGLLLIVVLTGFGLTAYHVARDNQFRRIDQELDQRLGTVMHQARPQHGPGPPPDHRHERGFDPVPFLDSLRQAVQQAGLVEADQTNAPYCLLWGADGTVLAASPGAPASVPPPASPHPAGAARGVGPDEDGGPPPRPTARTRGAWRELYRFGPSGECLLVGRSLAPDMAAMRRLGLLLGVAGMGVLLFGLAGGWWLASRAIRPIENISVTAMRIAAGDLAQRIDVADTDNELGRLAGVLNSTFARLEAAFAHQARFTSDASHELRTPVTVILSQTQTALARERPAPEYRRALEACQRAAQRMRRLTESLLQLARLDAGQDSMQRESFDLGRLTLECIDLVRPLAEERRVRIRCEPLAESCYGDPERIGQVITNLLTNAIHYNHEGGEIVLAAQRRDNAVFLTVADTGEGIPEEDLPHIFERFYRADKSRARAQAHIGLGLAISKAIIDAHNGSIEVTSRRGAGSTFTLRLPRGMDQRSDGEAVASKGSGGVAGVKP